MKWMRDKMNYPTMIFNISLANVMTIPPATVIKPLALWDGSCDLRDKPTCTIPKPSRIIPSALTMPNMKFEKLLTTVSGSLSASTCKATTLSVIISAE